MLSDQIVQPMVQALSLAIREAAKKRRTIVLEEGRLISRETDIWLYHFFLKEPTEFNDDQCFILEDGATKGTVIAYNADTVTLATEAQLSSQQLQSLKIALDQADLLKAQQTKLEHLEDSNQQIGNKTFGLVAARQKEDSLASDFTLGFQPYSAQITAIQSALGSEVTCIIGPPGTGKTKTLAAIALAHLQKGLSILVTSHTNIAVDNAIRSITEAAKFSHLVTYVEQGQIIRYGPPQDERVRNNDEVYLPLVAKRLQRTLAQKREQLLQQLHELQLQEEAMKQEEWGREEQLAKIRASYQSIEKHAAQINQRIATILTELNKLREHYRQESLALKKIRQEIEQVFTRYNEQISNIAANQHIYQVLVQEEHAFLSKSAFVQFFQRAKTQRRRKRIADLQYHLSQDRRDSTLNNEYIALLNQERFTKEHVLADLQAKHLAKEQETQPSLEETAELEAFEQIKKVLIAQQESFQKSKQYHDIERREMSRKRNTLSQQTEDIERQLREVEQRVLEQARIVCTTLTKLAIAKTIAEKHFDVIIIDEISMCPLPLVLIAACQAQRGVVLLGDPQQLEPIVEDDNLSPAEKVVVQQWLGQSYFDYFKISISTSRKTFPQTVLLDEQARMNPRIAAIPNKHFYDNKVKDSPLLAKREPFAIEPLPDHPLVWVDTAALHPIAAKPNGSGRTNYLHALVDLMLASTAIASLSPISKEVRVGIITPYKKQANLIASLLRQEKLSHLVQVRTVHRFQGMEFDIIIFDTADAPNIEPRREFIVSTQKALRLINVAITRAKQKLIFVTNSESIRRHFDGYYLEQAISEVPSQAIISAGDLFPLLQKIPPQYRGEILQTLAFYNEKTFYPAFKQAMSQATKSIVIFSPFLRNRTNELLTYLIDAKTRQVEVSIYENGEEKNDEARIALSTAGFKAISRPGMHEKIVIIDGRKVFWGSLNPLSQKEGLSTELMTYCISEVWAISILQTITFSGQPQNRNSPKERKNLVPIKTGEPIILTWHQHALLLRDRQCIQCHSLLQKKLGKHGLYYKCPQGHKNPVVTTEDVVYILELHDLHCPQDQNVMQYQDRYGQTALMMCTKCGYGQEIQQSNQ